MPKARSAILGAIVALLPAPAVAQPPAASPGDPIVLAAGTSIRVESASVLGDPAPAAAPVPQAPGGGGDWAFTMNPSLWVPAVSGTVGVGANTRSMDVPLSDAFENLADTQGALMGHLEIRLGSLTVFGEALRLDVDDNPAGSIIPGGPEPVTSISGWIFEAGVAYVLVDVHPPGLHFVLEPLGGVRVHSMHLDIEDPVAGVDAHGNRTWVDAIAGVRARLDIDVLPLAIYGRLDAGGGSSDSMWNAAAGAELTLAPFFSLDVGYRWLSVDFSGGSGTDHFLYDVLLEGPFFGLTVRF